MPAPSAQAMVLSAPRLRRRAVRIHGAASRACRRNQFFAAAHGVTLLPGAAQASARLGSRCKARAPAMRVSINGPSPRVRAGPLHLSLPRTPRKARGFVAVTCPCNSPPGIAGAPRRALRARRLREAGLLSPQEDGMQQKKHDDTNTAGSARTRRPTEKQAQAATVRCCWCAHFEEPGRDRVGWCLLMYQYRHADIERRCDSFSENGV